MAKLSGKLLAHWQLRKTGYLKHFLLSTQANYRVVCGDWKHTKPESIIAFERFSNSWLLWGSALAEWTLATFSAQT